MLEIEISALAIQIASSAVTTCMVWYYNTRTNKRVEWKYSRDDASEFSSLT